MDVITPEQQTRRISAIIREHTEKSKHKGDFHFRQAEQWGAQGDYEPGADDGESPQGSEEINR